MKSNPTTHSPRTLLPGLTAIVCLLAVQPAFAQKTWSAGGGADLSWSTGANWGGTAPVAAEAATFGTSGTVGTSATVNNIVDASFTAAIGSLTYNNTNGQFHTTQISSGQTLTVNGPLTIGNYPSSTAASYSTRADFTGGGTLVVGNGTSALTVDNGTAGGSAATGTLNLSGIDVFLLNVGGAGGTISLGSLTRGQGQLTLAAVTNILTGTALNVANNDTGGTSTLSLGAGTNILNVSAIVVGQGKVTGNIQFGGSTGGLSLRNAAGTGRASVTLGTRTSGGTTTAGQTGNLSLTGHPVDMQISTLILGRRNTGGTGGTATGTLTFNQGIVDVTTVSMGVASSGPAIGRLNVGGTGSLIIGSGGISLVNASVSGCSGTLHITNGGTTTLSGNIIKSTATGTGTIVLNEGTLNLQGSSVGSSGTRVDTLNLTNSTLRLTLDGTTATTAKIFVSTLNLPASATPATTIHVDAIANVASPTTFSIVNSTTRNGNAASFAVGDLPAGYSATVTSTATEIQLQVTPPVAGQTLLWDGAVNGDWDTSTANWQGSLTYNQNDDAVIFDDTLTGTSTVELTTALTPFSLVVSNVDTNYTFIGPGKLSGSIGLTKEGAGTLTFANDVANDFSGAIALNAGTLIYDQSVDLAVANAISGAGALVKTNTNTLTLSGASSYSGATTVSKGTLRPNNNGALGTLPAGDVTVVGGATLDIGANTANNNANFGTKQFYIAGAGVGGDGAIVNNAGTNQQSAFQKITLTDNATVGGQNRWDLRGGTPVLDLAGYTLTKTGVNQVTVVAGTITGGDIDINQGLFSVETTSSFTGSGTISVNAGGTLGHFRNNVGLFNRPVTLNGGAITNLASSGTVGTNSSDISLAADSTLGGSTGATYPLVFTGVISGSGKLTKTGAGPVVLTNINTYDGDTVVSTGALSLSGSGSIADSPVITVASGATLDASARNDGTLTLGASQTLEGNGTVNGAVVVNGTVAPGASVGTLAFGGALTLNSGAVMDMELGDGPAADEASASGAVTYGGTLKLTWTGATLTTGTVDLFDGSSFSGAFAAVQLVNWPDPALRVNTANLTTDGSIAITANAAPVAQNLTLGVAQGESVSLAVVGGKFAPTDADGDSIAITGVSAASSGTAGCTANTVTYTADGAMGTNTFTYTVTDAFGATDTKAVTVVVYSAVGFNKLSGPVSLGGGLYQLDYLGVPGEDYALDESPDLVPPYTWTPVITHTAAGNGTITYTVPLSYPSGSFRTRHVP